MKRRRREVEYIGAKTVRRMNGNGCTRQIESGRKEENKRLRIDLQQQPDVCRRRRIDNAALPPADLCQLEDFELSDVVDGTQRVLGVGGFLVASLPVAPGENKNTAHANAAVKARVAMLRR